MRINIQYSDVLKLTSKDPKLIDQIDIALTIQETIEFNDNFIPKFESWMSNIGNYYKDIPYVEGICNDVVNLKLTPISYSYDKDNSTPTTVTFRLNNRYWTIEDKIIIFN